MFYKFFKKILKMKQHEILELLRLLGQKPTETARSEGNFFLEKISLQIDLCNFFLVRNNSRNSYLQKTPRARIFSTFYYVYNIDSIYKGALLKLAPLLKLAIRCISFEKFWKNDLYFHHFFQKFSKIRS